MLDRSTTVVLDGNHRLAALLREARDPADLSVVVFRVRETVDRGESGSAPEMHVSADTREGGWTGFNPDVHLAITSPPHVPISFARIEYWGCL